MSSLLVSGIGELVTNDGDPLHDAAIVADGERIAWIGAASRAPAADLRLDAAGRTAIPGFVDSHTHLVFSGYRADEFDARMAGAPYAADGIVRTVAATRSASDEILRGNVSRLSGEALRQGTTTLECKSGYGLTVEDELRSLRIAGEFTRETTFLGAHVVPPEYEKDVDGYVDLICGPMLDACAPHARWVDVFCDAFDEHATRAILRTSVARGLAPRLHANQLGPGYAVRLAVECDAASADHCNHLSAADIAALAGSGTVATLLPAADFCTKSRYPDARRLIDAGVTVAISTDCNPGTSCTTSMPFCIALAVRDMGMTPTEAVRAATAGGARALRREDIGRVAVGCHADLVILDAPSHTHLAYRPGVPLIATVVRGGRRI